MIDHYCGLDPNVWFQNVEYVVPGIGQETITHVSHIYKYYIGYRLILETRAATKEAADKVKVGKQGTPICLPGSPAAR